MARPGQGASSLDEAPEFPARVLDALRQPLESGRLTLTRVGGTAVYPAAFTLLLAANPCPCAKVDACSCPPDARRRYLARLSGPLLDRIDMHVEVPAITRAEMLADAGHIETTAVVAGRVAAARRRAAARYAGTPWRTNGQVPPVELRRRWPVPRASSADVDRALELGALTARGYGRVLRLAWTLADLGEADVPGPEHVGHALRFRLGSAHGGLAA